MESPKKVLIVEDEKNIVDILRFNLQRAATPRRRPTTARTAWRKARSGQAGSHPAGRDAAEAERL